MKPANRPKGKPAVSSFPVQRRENRFTFYRLLSMVGLLVILGLVLLVGAQSLQQYRLQQELADYEETIKLFDNRNEELSLEIERLQDPGYLEVLARSRLGLVKPGEIIFQLEE